MSRKILWMLVLVFVVMAFSLPAAAQDEDVPVIGFMQLVSHPALDAGRDGAVAVLNEAGYVDGETARFIFANAEGDIPTLSTITQSFLDEGVDIIIATSTPALQAAYSVTQDLEEPLIIFNVVTSPFAAGVGQASCIHPAWVIGSQALAPYADTVPLLKEIAPDAETVGYIYNSAEANSVASTEIVLPMIEELGMTVEIQNVANSSEVGTAAEALASRGVDVFFVATDSAVVGGLEGLISVANENGIPIVASDPSSAIRGAAVAQGLDYTQEGRDAGRLAVAYLAGELDPAMTAYSRQTNNLLAVNMDVAEEQGATISDDLLARAGIVVQDGETTMAEMAEMDEDAMMEADVAFLEGLACTEDLIAEQQAELDAAASE